MEIKIDSLEPLSDAAMSCVEAETGLRVRYVRREDLSDKAPCDTSVLICRDRDDWPGIFRAYPRLRFVFILSVGVEKLPFGELGKKGVVVASPKGVNAPIMSEYAMAAILSHSTRLVENIDNQKNRFWKKFQCVDSLHGKTLLIVGAGQTGRLTAAKAKAFGMSVIGVRKHAGEVPGFDSVTTLEALDTVLPAADFVICTIPLTDETRGLFDQRRFGLMKSAAYFVNISRSGIVVTDDLKQALRESRIAGACVDVFDKEPLAADDDFWTLPNVVVTPHSSGRLENFVDKTMPYFVNNLKAFIAGQTPPNSVNLHEGY